MATQIDKTTEAAAAIPTIIAARMLASIYEKSIIAQTVTRDFDSEVANYGDTITVTKRGALSANDKAVNSDVTLQAPTLSSVDVTLDKHKEVSFLIEDPARLESRPDLLTGYMDDAVTVLAEKIDSDIAALYATLANDSSTTGTAITGDIIVGARQELVTNGKGLAEASNKILMVGYEAQHTLMKDDDVIAQTIDSTKGGDKKAAVSGLQRAYLSRFWDIDIYATSNITNQHAMLYTPQALALVTRPMPAVGTQYGVTQFNSQLNGLNIRLTMNYDADALGMKVTADVLYGVKILEDNFAVEVLHS